MMVYLAPMEGVTGFVVRNAFFHNFSGIDKYFTPFIHMGKKWGPGVKRDINPDNNVGINLVLQGISNNPKDIFPFEERIGALGYKSYNLNFGCPSGTVTAKGRGSGMLKDPENLDRFLDFVYTNTTMEVSVKTRIGFSFEEEWESLLAIFKRYPLAEFIVHPRLKVDMYSGKVRLEAFRQTYETFQMENIKIPLIYNGDIKSYSDYEKTVSEFSNICGVMIGRGFFFKPWIGEEIKTRKTPKDYKEKTVAFLEEIFNGYMEIFSGERDVIMHMKEIWGFLAYSFDEPERNLKRIRKCNTKEQYKSICSEILES